MSQSNINLSIIIPLYNEASSLPLLYKELSNTFGKTKLVIEIILSNDGSTDESRSIIEKLIKKDDRIKLVSLTRNFGQQAAIDAGLFISRGEYVGIMDADLQDPPSVLLEMYHVAKDKGAEVVYAVRKTRKAHFIKKLSYKLFYLSYKFISDYPVQFESGDFCILKRNAVDIVLKLPERVRFNRGLRAWIGLKTIDFPYDRPERVIGESQYSWKKLLALASTGIVSSTTKPLRLATIWGLVLFTGAIVLIALYLGLYVWGGLGKEVPGFATIIILILFLNGIQFLSLGIIGEYIGTIFLEVKKRPEFLIKDVVTQDTLKK